MAFSAATCRSLGREVTSSRSHLGSPPAVQGARSLALPPWTAFLASLASPVTPGPQRHQRRCRCVGESGVCMCVCVLCVCAHARVWVWVCEPLSMHQQHLLQTFPYMDIPIRDRIVLCNSCQMANDIVHCVGCSIFAVIHIW